jgi:hypothetical protein
MPGRNRQNKMRGQKGSLAGLIMVLLVPCAIAIGAMAVDMMKVNAVHSELQKACDAGALAGTLLMYQYQSPPSAGYSNILNAATNGTSVNLADGRWVANSSPYTTVVVTIYGPSWVPPAAQPPVLPPLLPLPAGHGHGNGHFGFGHQATGHGFMSGHGPGTGHGNGLGHSGSSNGSDGSTTSGGGGSVGGGGGGPAYGGGVQVTATMGVYTLFAKIFGTPFVNLTCVGAAGAIGDVVTTAAGEIFPIAVSLDTIGPDGTSLGQHVFGQQCQFAFANSSNGNCAWIGNASTEANWIANYHTINGAPSMGVAGSTPPPPSISATTINLDTGQQTSNESTFYANYCGKKINLPVFTGTPSGTKVIVGFVTIKVQAASTWPAPPPSTNTIWLGELQASEIAGLAGAPKLTGTVGWDSFIQNCSTMPVKLLK